MFWNKPAVISPKYAYDNGFVTNLINPEKQVGSDGIDLTVASVHEIDTTGTSVLTDVSSTCVKRARAEVPVVDGFYALTEGAYDIHFSETFNLPKGVCALILLRSSLVRDGHQKSSGLYDSGFNAIGGMTLHVPYGRLLLEPKARVAQVVFLRSDTYKLYTGQYNGVLSGNWFDRFGL